MNLDRRKQNNLKRRLLNRKKTVSITSCMPVIYQNLGMSSTPFTVRISRKEKDGNYKKDRKKDKE
jgi:hypothetical protein